MSVSEGKFSDELRLAYTPDSGYDSNLSLRSTFVSSANAKSVVEISQGVFSTYEIRISVMRETECDVKLGFVFQADYAGKSILIDHI